MSSSSEICTEVTDPDTQFNNGIKMIVSAYETQTSFLSNEITRLNKELSLRDSKIKKMDELCSSLLKEKSEYEAKVNSLSTINRSLSLQIETLRAENNSLKKVKDKIRETIEVDKIPYNTNKYSMNIPIGKNGNNSIFQYYTNSNSKSSMKSKKPTGIKKQCVSASNSFCIAKSRHSRCSNSMCSLKSDKRNNDFFKHCRALMGPDKYNEIMDIVRSFNAKLISKEETYERINEILTEGNYEELMNEFNKLFM